MISERALEVNFDGLVGPTHHYAGLSIGNVASQSHRYQLSRPRQAALEGLAKMRWLMDQGHVQAVLPPHPRPAVNVLRRLGFVGSAAEILSQARKRTPHWLHAVTSASAMWAANAATVSPSADTADGRVHFTPANLISQFHRSLEASHTSRVLQAIFPDARHFAHHPPLPPALCFADEGAANHLRLATQHAARGLEVFVFGFDPSAESAPRRFAPRQAHAAGAAIARLHQLDPRHTMFVQQHPDAIDAGVFHNDVIALAHENILFCHEHAFVDGEHVLAQLSDRFTHLTGQALSVIPVRQTQIPLQTAVATYLFNSQLLTARDGSHTLLCPTECRDDPRTAAYLDELTASAHPIDHVCFIPVRQSMKNGGGPACLRLRVVLTEAQLAGVHPGVMLDDRLYDALVAWVHRHYRETLSIDDLADPALAKESAAALAELYNDILRLPANLLSPAI